MDSVVTRQDSPVVDLKGFEKHKPTAIKALADSFQESRK
jgi:hypothetical protein